MHLLHFCTCRWRSKQTAPPNSSSTKAYDLTSEYADSSVHRQLMYQRAQLYGLESPGSRSAGSSSSNASSTLLVGGSASAVSGTIGRRNAPASKSYRCGICSYGCIAAVTSAAAGCLCLHAESGPAALAKSGPVQLQCSSLQVMASICSPLHA